MKSQTIQEPIRVLLVDDDADFMQSLKDLLEIENYLVETAPDAATAMSRLRDFHPDIALVDLRLGEDSGTDLVESMKHHFPELICVMVTAFSDTESAITALQKGVYDYLRKPFEAEQLYATLRRCAEKCLLAREKRAVDQALHESETRFRITFETSPDAIILARLDGSIIDVNASFERMTGHRLNNIAGKNSLEIGLWKDPRDREKLLEHVTQYGYANNIVAEFRMFDGAVRAGLVSARTMMLNGELTALYVVRDVQDIMARERALEESEKRFRLLTQEYGTVLDGIPDALMLIDPDLQIVWANKGAGQHFSYEPEQMKGMLCSAIWKCGDDNCLSCLKEVFRTGAPLESIQKMTDGRVWGVKQFPIQNDEGAVVNVVQIASDLTEKTKLREQATRSAHLAAIGELAAGVAHEVNNPIGMMLLDLPMLKDVFHELVPLLKGLPGFSPDQKIAGLSLQRLSDEVPSVIDEVYEGARKVKRIVEELRDFSRPTRGVIEEVDFNEVAQKAVRMVRNPLQNATEYFTETYAPSPLFCLGDPHRLEQVVVNLLLNACQALPDKTAKISLETGRGADGASIQLILRDEGCGICPEDINHISDPFYTTRREAGGTGLGLSVSSRIIAEHKGSLDFSTQPGQGTTVVVELPTISQDKS